VPTICGSQVKNGIENLDRHTADGAPDTTGAQIAVPMREFASRVVDIRALRKSIYELGHAVADVQSADPNVGPQNSSADFAIALLNLPWRQRFQEPSGEGGGSGAFVPCVRVAETIVEAQLLNAVKELL